MPAKYDLSPGGRGETDLEEMALLRRTSEGGEGEPDQLAALLHRQNELLLDLVCAVNGLAGAVLACRRGGERK